MSQHLPLIAAARRFAARINPARVTRGLLVACFALFCGAALAQSPERTDASFDHATTGFFLGAQHATARCESCHTQGVFRGTPRDCASCHRNTSRPTATQFPLRHIPTTQACDYCHRASVWNVTTFRHQGVAKGTCNTCHNGINATGKPANHAPTIRSCDFCHNTITWTATNYHTHATAGKCDTCHNGIDAKGKGPRHVATNLSCDVCHSTILWKPATYPHDASAKGTCNTCHGITALGKNTGHIPTSAQCDTCHTSTRVFTTVTMDHTGLDKQCLTCHNGAYTAQNALGKTAKVGHVTTTAQCDTCHHSTVAWKPAAFTHDASTAGTCSTCHNGITALGKTSGHVPTSAQCDTCHNDTRRFFGALMNHTGTAGQCSTCHGGAYTSQNAQAQSGNHVKTTAQCDSSGCHTSTSSWATATFNHALASPPVSIGDQTCANCHKSGGAGLPKPTNHIPTSGACDNCHNNFLAFKPAHMNHTGTAAQCSSCHSGSFSSVGALAKSSSHIPTAGQCDSCHTNFLAFRPASMNHAGTTGACRSCHLGGYVAVGALPQSATHIPDTRQCDTCHVTTAWSPANTANVHDANAKLRCSLCHNNVNAVGKGATHIPDNRQCDTCHTNGYSSFRPANMNHTGLTGQCSTCHSGGYLSENAQTKSASHQVTNAQCDTCHSSTTSWATATYNHTGVVAGSCGNAGCHIAGGAGLPKPTNHIPTSRACDSCHTNFSAFKPAAMDHTGTNGQCSTCHNGSYVSAGTQGAQSKSASHIPTSTQCDSCHTNYSTFKPAQMNHSTGTAGQCSTCHNGAYVSVGSQGALTKHATHIPTSAQCDASGCHSSTTTWTGVIYNHSGVVAGSCTTCHNGITAAGRNAGHIPTNSACDSCHKNYTSFKSAMMNHTGLSGQCSTCHNGGYLAQNAQSKSANHLVTTAQCDSSGCHTSTTSWASATFNHTGVTIGGHTCANAGCHVAGGAGLPKPSTHILTTQACDVCHKNFTAFNPAVMDHSGITASCSSCHNGTNASGKPSGKHIPTTQGCETCHRTTSWLPLLTPYAHTGITSGTCLNCHIASYANIDYKPAAHIPTPRPTFCDDCHRVTAGNWQTLIKPYSHTGVAAGNCTTCHMQSFPQMEYKAATHMPTTAPCEQCHKMSDASFVAANSKSNHTALHIGTAKQCANCHEWNNSWGLKGREPGEHKTAARMAPNSCDNSNCHSVNKF